MASVLQNKSSCLHKKEESGTQDDLNVVTGKIITHPHHLHKLYLFSNGYSYILQLWFSSTYTKNISSVDL
jgi:hypothetical protein